MKLSSVKKMDYCSTDFNSGSTRNAPKIFSHTYAKQTQKKSMTYPKAIAATTKSK
jgi:hypothetical protein